MNISDLRQSAAEFLDKQAKGQPATNPLESYYDSDRDETAAEKISFIEHINALMLRSLQTEQDGLKEKRKAIEKRLAAVQQRHQQRSEENAHLDSILKKVYELKKLHILTQSEAQAYFSEITPEQMHLAVLDRKSEELQASIDNILKERDEVVRLLEESREQLGETVREYEEKKSQEEHKLELLVVIQNVVGKKKEHIVDRNASLVGLKKEIEELKAQSVSLYEEIESTNKSIAQLSASISAPKSRLLALESEKSSLHATLATLDSSLDTLSSRLQKEDTARRQRLQTLEDRRQQYRARDELFGEKNRLRVKLGALLGELGKVGVRIEVEQRVRDMLGAGQ